MRFDLLAGLRKWRLIGALALMLVAITSVSTTVHAVQHAVSASASTVNPGDSEACGLCNLETTESSKPSVTADVVLCAAPAYGIPAVTVIRAPGDATFSESLRGPPVAA
jgi:hypothetical protein